MRSRILMTGNIEEVANELKGYVATFGANEQVSWCAAPIALDRSFVKLNKGLHQLAGLAPAVNELSANMRMAMGGRA